MSQVLKTFYDPRMSCPSGGYSPSGEKPSAVVADWLEHDLIEVVGFTPATDDDLALAHAPSYVRGIFAGEIENGHGNFSPEVAESTRWTVGSMVAAARAAYQAEGITCSPSSGFHHAHYDNNHGFCTFNGLIVAARKAIEEFELDAVGILDCDWHHGDGTQDIIDQLSLSESIKHFPSGARRLRTASAYFEWLESAVEELVAMDVGLILYQAGADAHRNDPLGGLLTDRELRERDQFVFEQLSKNRIPVAWNLAGGYQRDERGSIDKVLAIHRQTMLAARATQSAR